MGNHGPYSDRRPLALGSVGMTKAGAFTKYELQERRGAAR
jgi:hypothetical protein